QLDAEIRSAAATQAQPAAPVDGAASVGAEQTLVAPPPAGRPADADGRPKQRGGLLAALALLAVLVVIGALAASSLLGGSGDEGAGSSDAGQSNAQGGGNKGQSDGQSGGGSGENQGSDGDQQGGTSSASASASATPAQSELTAQAAEQTVSNFYTSSSAGNYDRSAQLLSESYLQSTFPNRATFESTFDKVESVVFIKGPNAEISGNTATVTGETQATLTGEIQHNEGIWYLVQEDGRWKIDGWDVVQLSSRSA
ncbi:MAG: hypothetical protein M3N03_08600, partial [Actinomycetota bacterium]|nr:hypothetical protein [Actinomycetota bacterium]